MTKNRLPYMQANDTVKRINKALQELKHYELPDENELSWLLETCYSVLTLALVHAKECEKLWMEEING